METKPYAYNRIVSQTSQQQLPEGKRTIEYPGQQQAPAPQSQKPKPAARMPKARTLELVHKFKQWLVVASLVGFGTFSGLAAFHQVTAPAAVSLTSSGSSQTTTSAASSSQSSSNFFNQQGGNNFGSSSSSQASVSGSSVS